MKYFCVVLIFVIGAFCSASELLEKQLLQYLKAEDEYYKDYENRKVPDEGILYVKLRNNFKLIKKVLDEHPEYIPTYIDSTIIYPYTTKADKIYCEIFKKYVMSKKGIQRKKAFTFNLSNCAGTKHTINLINEIVPSIQNIKLPKYNEELFADSIKIMETHFHMLEEIKNISVKKDRSGLRVIKYHLNIEFENEDDELFADDPEEQEKLEKERVKKEAATNCTTELLESIKLDKSADNFKLFELFAAISEQGGRHSYNYNQIMNFSKYQYAVVDSKNKIHFLLIFSNAEEDIKHLFRVPFLARFFVIKIEYDKENKPINHAASEIIPFSDKLKNILKETIYRKKK
jgi:hypothetical protein